MMIPTTYDKLNADIEKVQQIPIVPAILEVICRTTGMGFAAIARVTQERWIACSVRDEIQFGLKSGGELQIETTICNEIRDSGKPVIIDHVAEDEYFCKHHTPRMYGFQSYISIPIFLKNGEFFGTLCAIDPQPAKLNNTRTIAMFNLFAELISFHLQNLDLIQQTNSVVHELNRQLSDSKDENRQYQYISNHNLQEPLRKMRIFSSMLVNASNNGDLDQVKNLALKVSSSAQKFSMMIRDISEFSRLNYGELSFELVDLNKIVSDVCAQLTPKLEAKGGKMEVGLLPSLYALPLHIEQLFYHLISNAIKFSKTDSSLIIHISATAMAQHEIQHLVAIEKKSRYFEIRVHDNGIGIEKSQLEKIFDIFSTLSHEPGTEGFGVGLSYCRKIIRIHGGVITAESEPGHGTTFSMILPFDRTPNNVISEDLIYEPSRTEGTRK
jgi:signal transduction histidine kinase